MSRTTAVSVCLWLPLTFAAAGALAHAADAPGAPLPEITAAQLIDAIAESVRRYDAALLEADFEEQQDANMNFANKKAKPDLQKWPGHFSYASDGQRWRAEYEAKSISRSRDVTYLTPYRWTAGFDGKVHYLRDKDGWVIGENYSTGRALRPRDLFWTHVDWLLKGATDAKLRITGQTTVAGFRCYVLERQGEGDTGSSKRVISPRQSYLQVRYEQYYQGKRTAIYESAKLERGIQGLWFPRRLIVEWPNTGDNETGVPSFYRETRISRFEPRPEFTEDDFQLDLSYGEAVRDRTTGLSWFNDPWWPDLRQAAQELDWPPVDFTPLAGMQCHDETAIDGVAAPPLDAAEWVNRDPVDLERLRGQVVVLHFFGGASIPPTPEQFAALRELRNRWHSKKFEVVAIATGASNPEHVRQLAEEIHLPFPVAVDSSSAESPGKTFHAYGLKTYTGTFLIDAAGQVHRVKADGLVPEALRLLKEAGAKDLAPISTKSVHLRSEKFDAIAAVWKEALKTAPREGKIIGQVIDGQQALPKTRVTAQLRLIMLGTISPGSLALYPHFQVSTLSDDDGRYELVGLPKGSYELTFDAEAKAVDTQKVTIGPTLTPVSADMVLEQADGLDGRVVDASGEAIAGAQVKVRLRHHQPWFPDASTTAGLPGEPAVTDGDGRFYFTRLHVGGFTFDVTADGYKSETLENIAAGTHGIEVRLQRP
jgi:peroxiredoxin